MTKAEIEKIINPQYPWIYAPTTAPTNLVLKNGKILSGFFQYTRNSEKLEGLNKFTFIEFGEKAQNYQATGDESFVTVVDGDDLVKVIYPVPQAKEISLESVMRRVDVLRDQIEINWKKNENLVRNMGDLPLEWGLEIAAGFSSDYSAGATRQILLEGLSENPNKTPLRTFTKSSNEIISAFNLFMQDIVLNQEILLKFYSLVFGQPGKFRNYEATAYHRIPSSFRFSQAAAIPEQLDLLCKWYNQHLLETEVHPVFVVAIFHYRLLAIHPFPDGNGRLARIITSLILLHYRIPPPTMNKGDRVYYLDALQKADTGDLEYWIKYFSSHLIKSMESILSGNQYTYES